MKKISVLSFLGLLAVSQFTLADIAPTPGSKATTKIDGQAAQILFDSFKGDAKPLDADYRFVDDCNVTIDHGKTSKKKLGHDKFTKVTCSAYYCRGHHAVCVLEEQY